MPHIGHLKTRHQFERLRPVGARVAGDRSLGVTLGAIFHVARLGRSTTVESRPIAPLRIQFDSVRRVRHHQSRLSLAEQPRDSFCIRGVSA